ncbi:hypothetical protein BU24DRAFT_467942 [Aaosphaeria arxii CBS 175.79]|uniref:Uncharacterized protein n=1 Tax=Aaosphaeria arxii CBS 175.79 TaxID=1450172 RepID=A0A6A5X9Z8_9PLEO|nr:uncharacterized protein BU24DRAFT_467942 [Aaosphaeria arxii CBS 175.79]KAF2009584.1 hypothetical protein BU24DRAFT_467942 [Aaosphaeria arxii CBS 175.79]
MTTPSPSPPHTPREPTADPTTAPTPAYFSIALALYLAAIALTFTWSMFPRSEWVTGVNVWMAGGRRRGRVVEREVEVEVEVEVEGDAKKRKRKRETVWPSEEEVEEIGIELEVLGEGEGEGGGKERVGSMVVEVGEERVDSWGGTVMGCEDEWRV